MGGDVSQSVARHAKITPDAPMVWEPAILVRVIKAMLVHENGHKPDGGDWYPAKLIAQGVALAWHEDEVRQIKQAES